MSDMSKIALVREMLDSAERSVREARKILAEMTGDVVKTSTRTRTVAASNFSRAEPSEEGRVVEGVFDGQNMVDGEANVYPVPANYASKSKLIQGDKLKLTIPPDGRFLYKCTEQTPRKNVIGTLTYEDGQYKILAERKAYRVLLASVTFHRVEVGGQASVIVPDNDEAEWAAIDALLPS